MWSTRKSLPLPGLAMTFEMGFLQEQHLHLSVFDSATLFDLFKENLVGGPAIIFKRYAEADKTPIRENPNKLCKKVVGYDANALYFWALSQEMPWASTLTGNPRAPTISNPISHSRRPTNGWSSRGDGVTSAPLLEPILRSHFALAFFARI